MHKKGDLPFLIDEVFDEIIMDEDEIKARLEKSSHEYFTIGAMDVVLIAFCRKGEPLVLFGHVTDCCETFCLEDVNGDLNWLVDSPILSAYESHSSNSEGIESQTWTFYRISTAKGTVVLRFMGSSNGYYSEVANIMVKNEQKGQWRYRHAFPDHID